MAIDTSITCSRTPTKGAVSEYGLIEEAMAPVVPKTIADWILERF